MYFLHTDLFREVNRGPCRAQGWTGIVPDSVLQGLAGPSGHTGCQAVEKAWLSVADKGDRVPGKDPAPGPLLSDNILMLWQVPVHRYPLPAGRRSAANIYFPEQRYFPAPANSV